jgi:hypothetical protein
MTFLFKKIAFFFNFLFNIRKILQFRKINKKLGKKIQDREVDRIILKGQILKEVKIYNQVNTTSKFIPPWYKSKAEMREYIIANFGKKMELLDVKINHNLKLSA